MRRIALALALGTFLLTFGPRSLGYDWITDLPVYRHYGESMLSGQLPYRDFRLEYPPLALPAFGLPALAGDGYLAYRRAFAALMFPLFCAMVLLCGALARRSGGSPMVAMAAAALTPLLVAALIRTRFDLLPVALTLGALLLLCLDRPRPAMLVLGLGVMAKGFPLVVAPVALAWLVGQGRRREAVEGAVVLAATIAVVAGLAVAASPDGAWGAVSYHLDRPVQVESSPAAALYVIDALGGAAPREIEGFGSSGLLHPAAGALENGFAVLLLVVVAGFSAATARAADRRSLLLASLAAVAAFAVFGKVLSPQFMTWIAPLVALAWSWRLWGVAVAGTAAMVLTRIEFPARYGDLVRGEAPAQALVVARDSVLMVVVLLALVEVLSRSAAPAPGSGRWRWPGRPGPPRPAPR